MSSSDYIRYRRVMNGLNTLDTFPRVLTNTQYAEFKSISLEKIIQPVDKYDYWRLRPEEARVMSGVLRLNPAGCPDFCTIPRPNAVLQTVSEPVPLKEVPNTLSVKSNCRCVRTF